MDEKQVQNSDTAASTLTPVPEPTLTAPEPVSVSSDPMPESPTPEVAQTETPVIEVTPAPLDVKLPEPAQPTSSASAPLASLAPQTQPLTQQDERGFIRSLLVKAQAKIQFNKQKKARQIDATGSKERDDRK